ncbi:MAG: DUF4827 domain-containing protein [Paramuribaculum sp.]|nr:DUF4827 domain-containing protein [Paramuribaculum sp.]
MNHNMKVISRILLSVAVIAASLAVAGCEDGKSYAELLTDENNAVNRFLVDYEVLTVLPDDNNFEIGEDAPFYMLDDEGNVYMQLLEKGDGGMAEENQQVYFRFMRYNLSSYQGSLDAITPEGNANNMLETPSSFRYKNYSIPSSSEWGAGIQRPLEYIPLNSRIRLVIKSQFGWSSEISVVQPFLYDIRYSASQL